MASPCSLTNFNVNGVYGSKPLGYGMVKLIPSRSSPSNNVWKQKAKLHGRMSCKQQASARASYDGGSGRGHAAGDFVAGLVLGGAIFGTLGYVFAPQISRSLMSIDKSMFTLEEAEEWWLRRKLPKPLYDEKDLEITRKSLTDKIDKLNAAIDHVAAQLKAGQNPPDFGKLEYPTDVKNAGHA